MFPRLLAIAALLASLASAASAAPNPERDAPPPGIVPTTATLADVVALHRKALGSPLVVKPTVREVWQLHFNGLDGSQTILRRGDDYVNETVLGPFTTRDGSAGGKRWRQNANGITVALHDVHRQSQVSASAIARATDPNSGVTLLGETQNPPAYVLEVKPAGGRHEFVFYDKSSALTIRREEAIIDQRVVTTYDDYRVVNGQPTPFHIHSTDGRAFNDTDSRATEKSTGLELSAQLFDVPANRRTVVQFPPGKSSVVVPAEIRNGRIIAHLNINGRPADFLLDSGASSIVIDRGLVQTLGLTEIGKRTGATAGTYVASQTIVPVVRFGELRMTDVVMTVLPESFHPAPGIANLGLFGFDFLADVVLGIDYARGIVTAYDPKTFTPPPDATPLPVALDDSQPLVKATINGIAGERFIVDTGDDRTLLYTGFVRAHPEAFRDERQAAPLAARIAERLPVNGVGGAFHTRAARVRSVGIGPFSFPNHLVNTMTGSSALEYEDHDGLIGHDVLGFFTVYFDYPREQLLLVRNAVKP